ncbi:MAG TPA: hypothetical protein VJO53_03610 [Candidatus Acidoferrales bacterium]|nr:hypothetical protein [Candidatus Acidoferrales bacterium]
MKRTSMLPAMAALLSLVVTVGWQARAQDQAAPSSTASVAPNEISPGTRFLIGLQDGLSTKDGKAGDGFTARTLEPLLSADGTVLRPGAEIRGHIDKLEPAHQAGRARMWLTFDEIKTPEGWVPLVAMLDDVPGVHSIRVDYNREGEIEANSNKRREALQAAAAGAFVGAAPGVAARSGKDAAVGAAAGAVAAFMVTYGLGEELSLEKNTKLELILERSLFLPRT